MGLAVADLIGLSLVALILAGLADLFDGVVARRIELSPFEREFGVQLDTAVDVFSFVAVPALIGLLTMDAAIVPSVPIIAFVVAGLVRLAHFNTMSVQQTGSSAHHVGLPVTYSAFVLPFVFIATSHVSEEVFRNILSVSFLAMAVLFVVPIAVPKPRGIAYAVFPLLAVCLLVFWIDHDLNILRSFN